MNNLESYSYLLSPSELISFQLSPVLTDTQILSEIVETYSKCFGEDKGLINTWRKRKRQLEIIVYIEAFPLWKKILEDRGYQIVPTAIPTGEFESIQITKLKTGDYLWVEYGNYGVQSIAASLLG